MQVTCQSFLADRDLSLSATSSWGGLGQTLTKPFSSLEESCQLAGAVPAMGGFGRQQGELWLLKNGLKEEQLAAWSISDSVMITCLVLSSFELSRTRKNPDDLGRTWKSCEFFSILSRNGCFLPAWRIVLAFAEIKLDHLGWPLRPTWPKFCNYIFIGEIKMSLSIKFLSEILLQQTLYPSKGKEWVLPLSHLLCDLGSWFQLGRIVWSAV